MHAILVMERRLQDLERKFENKERMGEIVDVKFDDEKKRWYVKINDGEDKTPSGQTQNDQENKRETFKSAWLPWKSFSHGTIKMSVPPKKGQKALLRSPGGIPEMAVAEPYGYSPDAPSPSDKQDDIVKVIEDDDDQNQQSGQQQQQQDKYHTWFRETKDSHEIIIQKKKQDSQSQTTSKDAKVRKQRKMPEVTEDGDDDTVRIVTSKDGHIITAGKKKAKIKITGDNLEFSFGEKASWKMSDEKLEIAMGDIKWTLNKDGWKQQGGVMGHDGLNIGSSHKHDGVEPGTGQTGNPIIPVS